MFKRKLLRTEPGSASLFSRLLFCGVALLCLFPFVTPPLALLLGIILANVTGNPFGNQTSRLTKVLLQASVVGLGFGMNFETALKAGGEGFLYTMATIAATLLLGMGIGKLLRVDKNTGTLVSCGTAICGGSAIAAIAPVIQASRQQISVALGSVFILNSLALFVFPLIGKSLLMTQHQFGVWAAIAIHDTSSVVGAATRFGEEALEVATTVKLARALWIIPMSLLFAALTKGQSGKISIPWFIGYFVIAMILGTYLPPVHAIAPWLVMAAKAGLTVTLFLIGSSLSMSQLRAIGPRPLILAVVLWLIISVGSYFAVTQFLH
ncbi:MAG: putative sulfate exporter family transporter [Sphingobacteriales bacterium]|nr:MAG: putative sulfate exporter family transporter [Sphingobacteriales bacterium]